MCVLLEGGEEGGSVCVCWKCVCEEGVVCEMCVNCMKVCCVKVHVHAQNTSCAVGDIV